MSKLIAQAKRREAVSDLVSELVDFVPGLQEKAQAGSSAADAARPFEIPKRSEARVEGRNAKRPQASATLPTRQVRAVPGGAEGAIPGSLVVSQQWLSSGKELYISGLVWQIPNLARKLSVPAGSKCWPWILSRKSEANKPGICKEYGRPGHKHASDTAHTIKPAPDLIALSYDPTLCRFPAEATLHARMKAAGLPSAYMRPPHPPGTAPGGTGGKGRGPKEARGKEKEKEG